MASAPSGPRAVAEPYARRDPCPGVLSATPCPPPGTLQTVALQRMDPTDPALDALARAVLASFQQGPIAHGWLRPRVVGRPHPRRRLVRFQAPGVVYLRCWLALV